MITPIKQARRFLWTLVFLLSSAVVCPAAAGGDPIRLLAENPRYLEWRGHATALVASGEHYGSIINPDFDFIRYLDTIQAAGLNHTRVFLGDYVEGPGDFGIANNPLSPAPGRFLAPWARSDVPGYPLGGNKFDLDRWDPAYFARLHQFLDACESRGIVVEAVLFFAGPQLSHHPLAASNNVNGTANIDAHAYLSLDNGNVLARQEAYCRKLVDEINRHDGVILNLCNEPWFDHQAHPGFASPPADSVKAWIRRVSEWVADEESRLPKQHLMSVDFTNQGAALTAEALEKFFPHVSLFNVHYDANAEILRRNPSLGRALAFNETGFNGLDDATYRTQGWRFLLSGGALYGNLDFSFTVGHEDGSDRPRFLSATYNSGGSAALRRQLGVLAAFMGRLPLAHMHPDDSIVVGGPDSWCALAAPGEAYALWFPGDGPFDALINLPAGRWNYEWVDILTGATTTVVADHTAWVAQVHGERHGGGTALRITPADAAAKSGASVAQEGSAQSGAAAAGGDDPAGADAVLEQAALAAMRAKAAELKISGVAVAAIVHGGHLESWTSAMSVVGRYKDEPTATDKGANLLGIAYAKASEMADTLKPSGHAGRPPMTGEFGWSGGAIGALPDGYVIAAFSGGKSEDDFEVSKAGVLALNGKL